MQKEYKLIKTPDHSGVFCLSIFFKNQIQNGIDVKKVKISAIGWVISTPSILKKNGKVKISGIK